MEMTILVDMDDTEQMLKAWVKRANEKFGRAVRFVPNIPASPSPGADEGLSAFDWGMPAD